MNGGSGLAARKPAKSVKKKAKGVKNSKTAKAKSVYTAGQRGAYQLASKRAIQKAQLTANAHALQSRRLQGAAKARSKLAAKGAQLFAARIKVRAVHQTYFQTVYGRQSKLLRVQAAHHLFKAQSIATNRQFAYSGEAIHARTTTLQTLTNAQALTSAQRLSQAARRRILRPKKATGAVRKGKTARSKYTAVGAAAGRAAAARVPASKTRKAPLHRPETLADTQWITAGNDLGEENCVSVAIANHLLMHTGRRVTDEEVRELDGRNNADLIAVALTYINAWDRPWGIDPANFSLVHPDHAEPGMLVGFTTETGRHCGVLMPDSKVVSWGEVVPLESEIDEAWSVVWKTR